MSLMRSWKTPTPDDVSRAIALLAQPRHREYFFAKLDNPLWLPLLRKRGWFRDPPAPVRDPKANTIRFPAWPESRYLARIARHSVAEQDVLQTTLALPDTENLLVREDVAEVALALPPSLATQLVPRLATWAPSSF